MDEENIYEDLDNFILEQQVEQVQETNKELQETIEKLEETTKKFNAEITELKTIKHNLERNISSLFKTAKSEIERKDRLISELRKELDNLKFRRGNNKKIQKGNNEDLQKELDILKCVIEQKNRIIQSLTKELENVKKEFLNQEKQLKRNSSHFDDDDLRGRLSKKRKLDDKTDKRDKSRPRSRSRSRETRYSSRSKFDKKRTIRRNRSGSFEKRRNSMIEKHRSRYENSKYSRSRSPDSHKKYNSSSKNKYQEKINKIRSRSRSSSIDKKHHKHSDKPEVCDSDKNIKCEKKATHMTHLIKEDSGMSSSNSHTSELVLKCDEIKASLLEEDLEEGEIDCTLEDIISDEGNMYEKQKVCIKKEHTRKTLKEINTKIDKVEVKKSNKLNIELEKIIKNEPEKIIKNESEKIFVSEKEVKPLEKENIVRISTINTIKAPELIPELVEKKTVIPKENKIDDDLKSSHDILELMVQNNYLDELDIDEEIVKMRRFEDDKRKKRKEDKDRISKLRSAISECKQNIQLLEHNFCSEDESETEDEFNKTASCVEENIVNTKQNNLVLKISRGSIVSNVEPKTDTLDDTNQTEIQKIDEVLDKNPLGTNNPIEIVDTIEKQIINDVLDVIPIDTKDKHIEKLEEILDKNAIDTNKIQYNRENRKAKIQKCNEMPKNISYADRKESSKNVKHKSVKEIPKIEQSKSSELRTDNDNDKKRKDTNEKCKLEKAEKITSNKNIIKTTIDKIDSCVQETSESVEFRPKLVEKIIEDELFEAISAIADDVKVEGTKFEQNFANITNLEGQTQQTTNTSDPIENQLNEIFDAETEKKENVSQEVNDVKETKNTTNNRENETQRKPPLKARRRRAFICIS